MRKYFLSIVALVGMLFATSCQESLVEPQVGGTTTFTVQVPDQMGTKAIGGHDLVNKLYVEVYAQGDIENVIYKTTADKKQDGSFEVSINLIQDQHYSIIFWAQKEGAYIVENLRSIPMNVNHPNNESGAAFFAYLNDFVPTGTSQTVTLKRPFAQLNLGTTKESLNTDAGHFELSQSEISVKGVAESFNTVLGYGEGSKDVYFELKNVPAEVLKVADNDYKYISMNYLPVAGDNKALVEVKAKVTVKDAQNNTQDIYHVFTSVPVQENYRTNIVGNLISSSTDFNVVVDDKFDGELPQTAEERLRMAAQVGGEFTLTEDIVLTQPLEVTGNMVINMNDKTISGAVEKGANEGVIKNYADLTISGGTIISTKENGGAAIYNEGNLIIQNMTITGAPTNNSTGNAGYAVNSNGLGSSLVVYNSNISGRGAIGATNGTKVEINGGTYHTPTVAWGHAIYANGEGTEVIINDGTFSEGYEYAADLWGMYQIYSGNKAKVIVNGGDFSQKWDCANGYDLCTATEGTIEIYGGVFADDPSKQNKINYVATGHKVITKDGKYYVVENDVDIVVENNADIKTQLAAAIQNGETEITIDAANNNIGALYYTLTQALVPAGTEVTIKNAMVKGNSYGNGANGDVIFENCVFTNSGAYSIHFDNGSGNVTFKNCILYGWNSFGDDLTSVSFYDSELYGNGTYALIRSYANLRLENCYFDITNANHQDVYSEGVEVISPAEMVEINCEWVVSSQEQLVNAATNSSKVYLTDGDYDLKGIQKDGLTLIGIGENVKVANTTNFASGSSVGAIWKAINLENVTITNTVFTMDEGSNATFKNVYFEKGVRQAYGNNVKFEICSFGSNSEGYALHFQTDANDNGNITIDRCQFNGGKVHLGGKRTYDFKECNFEAGTDFQVWSNITLENCSVDGTIVTSANIATLFPNLDLNKVTIK